MRASVSFVSLSLWFLPYDRICKRARTARVPVLRFSLNHVYFAHVGDLQSIGCELRAVVGDPAAVRVLPSNRNPLDGRERLLQANGRCVWRREHAKPQM